MTIRRFFLALSFAGTLAAQTFLHLSDPQFGMYSKNANFQHETVNFEFAIATANRLKPAFVVITGDLTNDPRNPAQTAEFKRIAGKLDPGIKLYNMPGNHDVQNEPTADSLASYRERFGPDYYTFQSGGITGIVLNSNLEKGTKNVPQEAAKMEAWFKTEVTKAKAAGAKQIIVFQHIPFFRKDPNEPEVYENVPVDVRLRYLDIMHRNGVKWVFAGHQHQNEEARDGDLQVIATGPVGMPLHGARSGIRVVAVTPEGVSHKFYDFGEIPELLEVK
jgi:3',5'-cyclic AMP phosphodiesterase CpdA